MVGLLFFGVFVTITIDTSFGAIEVKSISIIDEDLKLRGLLYKPKTAVAENPAAAVVLAHGISGSKEMVSGIGLELSRRGFVALCLDL
jgi:dienelactone hydrolase